jgi:hypothetical protein
LVRMLRGILEATANRSSTDGNHLELFDIDPVSLA